MPLDPCLSGYGFQAIIAAVGGHGMGRSVVESSLSQCLTNISL